METMSFLDGLFYFIMLALKINCPDFEPSYRNSTELLDEIIKLRQQGFIASFWSPKDLAYEANLYSTPEKAEERDKIRNDNANLLFALHQFFTMSINFSYPVHLENGDIQIISSCKILRSLERIFDMLENKLSRLEKRYIVIESEAFKKSCRSFLHINNEHSSGKTSQEQQDLLKDLHRCEVAAAWQWILTQEGAAEIKEKFPKGTAYSKKKGEVSQFLKKNQPNLSPTQADTYIVPHLKKWIFNK